MHAGLSHVARRQKGVVSRTQERSTPVAGWRDGLALFQSFTRRRTGRRGREDWLAAGRPYEEDLLVQEEGPSAGPLLYQTVGSLPGLWMGGR